MTTKFFIITIILVLCIGIQFGLILSLDFKISEYIGIVLLITMSITGIISLFTIILYFTYLERDIEKLMNQPVLLTHKKK